MTKHRKIPKEGDVISGKVANFTTRDVVFDLGHGLTGLMPKSYLVWLRRPTVKVSLTKGKVIDLLVKVVSQGKRPGKPHIYLGHLHTDERPWDQARKSHPIGSRATAKVLEFVPIGAIVEFDSGFWAWHYDEELSWTESLKAIDVLRRGEIVEVVVKAFDSEKRRIIVSRRLTELPTLPPPLADEHAEGESHTATIENGQPLEKLIEGAVHAVELNAYERNPVARSLCLAHYGNRCVACGFDFRAVYGPRAEGVIHVHHLKPLSEIGQAYEVDPISDLRPVCPNCHAVIHLGGGTLPIREVKRMMAEANRPPD